MSKKYRVTIWLNAQSQNSNLNNSSLEYQKPIRDFIAKDFFVMDECFRFETDNGSIRVANLGIIIEDM